MTDRRPDQVDAFLADLGSAPVPAGLDAAVSRRIRDERSHRATRTAPWMLLAAALAMLALAATVWIVAGPGPTPAPVVRPSASVPASPSPSASPVPSSSPSASASGAGETTFRLTLNAGRSDALPVIVIDHSMTMTGVAAAGGGAPDANPVGIGQGGGPGAIVVRWVGGGCDQLAQVEVDATASTVTVSTAKEPIACDAIGIDRQVELRFAGPVDPGSFRGTDGGRMPVPGDIAPAAVAFTDTVHGFVAGTDGIGAAVVRETFDGGARWTDTLITWGNVVGMVVDLSGEPWAAVTCDATDATCAPGIYRRHGSRWTRILDGNPTGLSMSGTTGLSMSGTTIVAVVVGGGKTGDAVIRALELRVSSDGGATWATVADPCPASTPLEAAAVAAPPVLVAVCEGGAATGMSIKSILRSTDRGRTWSRLADGPYPGTGSSIDMAADGTGWFWAPRSHLLETKDGGARWTPLDVADGDARIVEGADAWGGGAGVALVWDPNRQATLLLRTADGNAWTEMAAFPALPASGGG